MVIDRLDHEKYMSLALKQAEKAYSQKEVPIGAIVIDKNGVVIGRGYNKMEKIKCQTGHAEIIAIKKACKKIGDWRLDNCSIYITLEPCPMCLGLIQLSRINSIIFGARSPLFGFGYGMIPPTDGKKQTIHLLKKDLSILEGIKQEESVALLQKFFKTIRKKDG
jgi:tRNA(adenine34) deaminase